VVAGGAPAPLELALDVASPRAAPAARGGARSYE